LLSISNNQQNLKIMKKQVLSFIALSALALSFSNASAQSELQVIHNCADPAAATVDIYVNGVNAIDDFAFRTATPFINLPSGTPLNIGVAPGNSTSANDTLVNFTVTLAAGEKYVAIASGVLDPFQFAANPTGNNTGFGLTILTPALNMSQQMGNVDLAVNHGSTDAPAVDVIARGVATLVDDAAYGDVTSYLEIPAGSYILDITPANDNSTIVASFEADLTTLAGGAGVVFASGFLDPSANQNGEAFGLFVAFPNGSVAALPSVSQARLQVIHNAADPGAASVDVYVDGALAIPGFAFRTATPFLDLPAGVPVNIGIAGPNSTSANDTLVNFTVVLENGQTYVAIANGVLVPGAFAANPDGRPTGFTLFISDDIRESASITADVEFIAVHGATDAPTVDVLARNITTLVDDAAYSDITGYINVPPSSYILDVTPGNDNSVIVASYIADLSGLAGGTAVVFASGFLDPASNQNGPAFGLFAALTDGTVIPFAATSQARLQAIHNAADPAATSVDVYVDGALAIPGFAFRTATPFLDVPAGVTVNIGIAPGGSTGVNDTLVNFPVVFENGQKYVAIANGVLNPASFAANPDGRPIAFTLLLQDDIRESAVNAGEVDFRVVHGSTDAITVDVQVSGGPILVDDAAYTDITPYLSVPAASYILEITPGNNNSVIVATYVADLTALAGGSAVIFASGFLDPAANQNGPSFGIWATLTDGTTFPLPVFTSINELSQSGNLDIYPNPVSAGSQVYFTSDGDSEVSVEILNINGQVLKTFSVSNNESSAIETTGLSSGVYMIRTFTNKNISVSRLVIR
jgi:hypothetical protein